MKHKKYALFIGRWQPFHEGHKYIVDQAIKNGEDVCVAIRDTEISSNNPYSYEQRKEMIERVYGNKVAVVKIPDIKSINIGRKVGYDVNRIDPPADIGKISGTNVREGKETSVPPQVQNYLDFLRTTILLTGLPCSGKTTIAKKLKEELENKGYNVVHLDGDDVRTKLNSDLGFSDKDRKENLRRISHVSQLFNNNLNIVLASFVSPTEEMRELIKSNLEHYKLCFVDCSLDTCMKRDVKGMYKKAKLGIIKNFTGFSAPFEKPKNPDIVVNTDELDLDKTVEKILGKLL